jgi:hypothetical protein
LENAFFNWGKMKNFATVGPERVVWLESPGSGIKIFQQKYRLARFCLIFSYEGVGKFVL